MESLPAIAALYAEIDARFEGDRAEALRRRDTLAAIRLEEKQKLNDQAYFILCWGQLETAIDDSCRATIRRGRRNGDWKVRRAWELYNPEDKRLSGLSFEERASLVLDRSQKYWKDTIHYYNLRNQIAHGRLQAGRIEVPDMVKKLYVIQSAIASVPI